MHLGMTGMVHLRGIDLPLVMMENGGDLQVKNKIKAESDGFYAINDGKEEDSQEWPPRFTKFELTFSSPGSCDPSVELAFTDPRRLARVRLIEGIERDLDLYSQGPLAELGPDYSKQNHPETHSVLSRQAFHEFIASRQAAIKSLLLNQAHFAGVGNWVLDEILFHAKVHPGQVMAQMRDDADFEATLDRLYDALIYICQESVRLEGSLSKFPNDWLMLHRWGKRRQRGQLQTMADGRELDFVTVGGRTSCFAPSVQVLGGLAAKKEKVKEKGEERVRHPKLVKTVASQAVPQKKLRGETLLQDGEKTVLVWTLDSIGDKKEIGLMKPQSTVKVKAGQLGEKRKRQTPSISKTESSREPAGATRKSRRLLDSKTK